jgi:gluconolactonase
VKKDEEIIVTGLAFPEGPSIDRQGTVYFVELANHCVSKVSDGRRVEFANLGGSPNGTAFAPDGLMYVCNGGGNWPPTKSTNGVAGRGGGVASIQVVRPDGTHSVVLTEIGGVALNGPNDICFDTRGGYYFTDPAWAKRTPQGVARAEESPPGDVCYVAPDGKASRVAGNLLFPNGLHVTPDGRALVLAETGTGRVWRYAIGNDGALSRPEVLIDLGLESGLDGMCFDAEGRLLIAGCGPGKIFVLTPDLKSLAETFDLSDPAITNLCFGGDDFRTIFVTQGEAGRLIAIRWQTPGMRLFPDR